jgi:hypothetical protein
MLWYDTANGLVKQRNAADNGWITKWDATKQGLLDQSLTMLYSITDGSANTYTATLDPVPTALNAGMVINLKIHASNNGASTINVNSLGAKPIIKNGGEALRAGDLPENAMVSLLYTGTSFHLIGQKAALDKFGLGGPAPFWHSDSQIKIPAGCWINADTGTRRIQSTSELTVDITTSGASGLDTGSEASNTSYYLWLCQGTSGVTAILSTSMTSPTLPAGFNSFKALLPILCRNDGSSNLLAWGCTSWAQGGVEVQYLNRDSVLAVSSFGSTSYVTVTDMANFIPPFAQGVRFSVQAGALQDIFFSTDGSEYGATDTVSLQALQFGGTRSFIPTNASGLVEARVGSGVCTIYPVAYRVVSW